MRKRTLPLVALLTALSAGTALAQGTDTPPAGWINKAKVEAILKDAGYTTINNLEVDKDDGYWDADGVKQDGMSYDVHIDGKTGKILSEEMDMD